MLPWLIAVQLLLSIGLVLPIATLSVFYRDVQHGLPILLTSLFYISPVFYPASFVPDAVRPLYMLNPIAGLLTLYQTVVYDGRLPSAGFVQIMTGAAVLLAWIGYGIFNRYQSIIPEVV